MIIGLRHQVPTLAEVRAVGLAVRRRSLPDAPLAIEHERRTDPDEALLERLADPFESVDDVRTRLESAEAHLRARSDRRSVFLTVYTEMTASVEHGIESGAFEDPDWVRDYLVGFAERYRVAAVDFERGTLSDVPLAWRIAFHASTSGSTLLVQDALLGVNAHIDFDLPFALRDVSIDPDRPSKRRDHDRINRILRRLVDVVQRAIADVYDARGYARIDDLLGSFDEDFTLVGLTEARSLAWRNAVLLTDARPAVVRRFVRWRIRAVATGAGSFILAPSADQSVLWALRRLERGDPPIGPVRDAFRARIEDGTGREDGTG